MLSKHHIITIGNKICQEEANEAMSRRLKSWYTVSGGLRQLPMEKTKRSSRPTKLKVSLEGKIIQEAKIRGESVMEIKYVTSL